MTFADAKFLPSGTYAIVNVEHNRSISFNKEGECFSASEVDYGVSPPDVFADIGPDAEEGEDIASIKNPPKPHQIYSPTQPDLFWNLPNGDDGASLQLSADRDNRASFWKFKKLEKVDDDSQPPDPMKQFVAAPAKRPTQLDSAIKNAFAVTIPAGWLTTISSVSCGSCVNLVRVRRLVNGGLEKEDLISGWDTIDKAMSVDGSDSDSLALPSAEDAYVLVIEAFNSSNRARKDPRKLPGFKDLSTNLRVITIFDESDVSSSGRTQNAIITIHASVKVAVDLNDPGNTVNKGYKEDLDSPRPAHMDQWLKMLTVAIYQAPEDVVQIFGKIKPKAAYGQIKPINIVILTNSPPSDNPTRTIRAAAQKLNQGLHHPNAIAIQFTQIGNDKLAKTALKKLSDDPSFNIVDTVTFGNKFTPENLQNSVLNAMHPSVRAKVASSSGLQFGAAFQVFYALDFHLIPKFLVHYRVYNDEGAIVTRRPAYLTDTYLGRVRSKWVAPPHNAGSLRHCLALMESIDPTATTLFAALSSKSALADDIPISFKTNQTLDIAPDEPVALLTRAKPGDGLKPGTENLRVPPDAQSPLTPRFQDGKWPGSTPDNHVMFKFTTQLPLPTFSEGSRYMILNSSGKAMTLWPWSNLYLCNIVAHPQHRPNTALHFYLKTQNDGGIALRSVNSGQWAGPNFRTYPTEHSYYFIPTESKGWFSDSICPDKTSRQAFFETQIPYLNHENVELRVMALNTNDPLQRWRVVPAP
ncbi:hypothetical protein K443DRAFT_121259 [Laccaria amethystina LaAM-08-1]|uniref:Uncharacterized protein n=1 Tax=Laccaria amethystina LaAM-08-1 TaxID=1095629 RepID=A0A0C9XQJ4_9AGAR|nr:hypothetical protein K443DRAFT_121259 [Laccaria amethystina LaAM-08-1]